MKTKKQVIKDNPELTTVINAVINRVGMHSVMDVVNHGIDGGFNGFIYYVDTHRFAIRHRDVIIEMLEELSRSFGEEITTIVKGFGVFRYSPMDSEGMKELYCYLGGGKCEQSTITNIMAWFCAEQVCMLFD